jgi:hypothetical protein
LISAVSSLPPPSSVRKAWSSAEIEPPARLTALAIPYPSSCLRNSPCRVSPGWQYKSTDKHLCMSIFQTCSFSELPGTTNLRCMTGSMFDGVQTTTDGSAVRTPSPSTAMVRPKWGSQNPPTKVSNLVNASSVPYLTCGRCYFKPEHIRTSEPCRITRDSRRRASHQGNQTMSALFLRKSF